MKYTMLAVLFLALLATAAAQQKEAPNKTRLASVKKLYIGSLGNEEGSDLVREKIRIRLMKSDRFSVVERQEAADAILTGVAGVERRDSGSVYTTSDGKIQGGSGTSYAGLGVLRLVDAESEETIWVFEYKRGFSFGSASSRVANKTVEKLLKDAMAADVNSKAVNK